MGKVKRNQKRMILHLWPNEYWIIITAEGPEESSSWDPKRAVAVVIAAQQIL